MGDSKKDNRKLIICELTLDIFLGNENKSEFNSTGLDLNSTGLDLNEYTNIMNSSMIGISSSKHKYSR